MPHQFIDQTKHACEKCGKWVYVNVAQGPDDTTYTVDDHPGACVEEQYPLAPSEVAYSEPKPESKPEPHV